MDASPEGDPAARPSRWRTMRPRARPAPGRWRAAARARPGRRPRRARQRGSRRCASASARSPSRHLRRRLRPPAPSGARRTAPPRRARTTPLSAWRAPAARRPPRRRRGRHPSAAETVEPPAPTARAVAVSDDLPGPASTRGGARAGARPRPRRGVPPCSSPRSFASRRAPTKGSSRRGRRRPASGGARGASGRRREAGHDGLAPEVVAPTVIAAADVPGEASEPEPKSP